ncbi:hypothetical protein [Vibrio diabolicus]|uniref:hypothetical protein n=1 Tax=Vibrio diabolicus TaxID=50719 RepID=UPI00375211C2
MQELSQSLRKAIVLALEEATSYRDQLDLSRFIQTGVTVEQIHLIDTAMYLLRLHPYLSQDDFESKYSVQKVQLTIGSVDNFKKLLNLNEYTYHDWLKTNGLSEDEPLCLPYMVYQHFSDEIRRDYMNGAYLVENLQVQLGSKQLNHFKFRCGTVVGIPTDVFDIMIFILISRFGKYSGFKMNLPDSVLHLFSHTNSVDIEVRTYATEFSHRTQHSVCLIDDLNESSPIRKVRDIIKLEEFSIYHKCNSNRELLDLLDFS